MSHLPAKAKESINFEGIIYHYLKACQLSESSEPVTSAIWEKRAQYVRRSMIAIANEHGIPTPKKKEDK